MTLRAFFSLLLTLYCSIAFSQSNHLIDRELENCLSLDSNMTTSGMAKCTHWAEDAWDNELNQYYKLLMTNLSEAAQKELRLSQRQWIQFRDTEFDFISKFYLEEKQGTMWIVIAASKRMEIVRNRALTLKEYYDSLTE